MLPRKSKKRIQRRERLFKDRVRGRFATCQRRKSTCSKLMMDREPVSGPQSLLEICARHFGELARSKVDESEELQALLAQMNIYWLQSLWQMRRLW